MRSTATVEVPVEKFRKDYKPTDFMAKDIDLTFQINDRATNVLGKVKMARREGVASSASLRLDAEDLDLQSVKVNGEVLPKDRYSYPEKDVLEITGPLPEGEFVLETEVVIKPEENTQLSGLYKSSGMYCTQCEAEGFRRITPMLDRPDAMAMYKVLLLLRLLPVCLRLNTCEYCTTCVYTCKTLSIGATSSPCKQCTR